MNIKFFYIIALISLGLTSYVTPLLAQQNHLITNNSQSIPIKFNEQQTDGSSRGRPGGRKGTGSRGDCPAVEVPLTALIPPSNLSLTVEEYPTLWFYVPYKINQVALGEFSLQDEQNNDVYRTAFTPSETPGIISFNLKSAKPLEINKKYQWYFKLYCQNAVSSAATKSSTPVFVSGWVERVTLKPQQNSRLKAAKTPRERIAYYAEDGIWQSALSELAQLHFIQPENAIFNQDWANLLQDVGLENLAQKPIVGEVKN